MKSENIKNFRSGREKRMIGTLIEIPEELPPELPIEPPPRRRVKASTPSKPPGPSESEEQQTLFQWVQWMEYRHPELRLLYHIPNEGKRSKATGGRLVAEGLKKGVPDIYLPIARQGFHGLYIELKSMKGRLSREQKLWLIDLRAQGYRSEVCYGWYAAALVLMDYLGITLKNMEG